MKRTIPFIVAAFSIGFGGMAYAGSVAGALDGDYRSPDGALVLVDSADARVGLDGLDCLRPVVRNDRIASNECWGNGHRDADLDAEWRVDGDVLLVRGKRYTRLPAPVGKVARSLPGAMPATVDPTGRPWRHNGSIVMADPGTDGAGMIAYLKPKASLAPAVSYGTVLFRGELRDHQPIRGIAYAYKQGCPAAPYPVRGTYADSVTLVLRGAGPVRRGCDVVGYSDRSPHAVLRFTYLLDD